MLVRPVTRALMGSFWLPFRVLFYIVVPQKLRCFWVSHDSRVPVRCLASRGWTCCRGVTIIVSGIRC